MTKSLIRIFAWGFREKAQALHPLRECLKRIDRVPSERAAAYRALGDLYALGIVLGRNPEESLKWYLRAAAIGDPRAQEVIDRLRLMEREEDERIRRENEARSKQEAVDGKSAPGAFWVFCTVLLGCYCYVSFDSSSRAGVSNALPRAFPAQGAGTNGGNGSGGGGVNASPTSGGRASGQGSGPEARSGLGGLGSGTGGVRGSTGSGDGGPGKRKTGWGVSEAEIGRYHRMIRDRFHSRWEQPKSVVRSNKDFVTTLKIGIRRDGTILSREIVNSSGNRTMDVSVQSAANKVVRIDPLPDGIQSDPYEVKIQFKLDQN